MLSLFFFELLYQGRECEQAGHFPELWIRSGSHIPGGQFDIQSILSSYGQHPWMGYLYRGTAFPKWEKKTLSLEKTCSGDALVRRKVSIRQAPIWVTAGEVA